MIRSFHLAFVCALALAATACSGDSSSSTAPSSTVAAAGTTTFIGTLAPGGTVVRTFLASSAGTVTVTLATTDPASTLLGLGIGIPGNNIGACDMTKTVQTRAGSTAQLTASVDAGFYCAGVFDVGTVGPKGASVTIAVAYP